jgi:hypothetical protein
MISLSLRESPESGSGVFFRAMMERRKTRTRKHHKLKTKFLAQGNFLARAEKVKPRNDAQEA